MRYWHIFTGSFYSARAYADMRYKARGWGLGYSFILVAVTTVLLVCFGTALADAAFFTAHRGQPPLFDDLARQIGEQWPGTELKEGVLIVHAPMPYYIHLKAPIFGYVVQGDVLTIDTTGKTTPHNMGTPLLLNSSEFVSKARNGHEIRIHELSEYSKPGSAAMIVTPTRARAIAEHVIETVHANLWKLYILLGFVTWIIFTALLYLLRLCMLLAVAVAGLLLGKLHKSPLDFAASMRLSAMAYTPITLLDSIVLAVAATALPRGLLFLLASFLLGTVIHTTRTGKK